MFLAAALIVGGFFAPNFASAAATVTPASGGTDISIDTTSATGGSGDYKTLSGPSITETAPGDIVAGTHTITLPTGWEFNTGSTVNVFSTAGDITPDSQIITPDTNSFTFEITSASTLTSGLAFRFNNMQVRPTGTESGISDDMTYSGAGIAGVDEHTNFGTLSTIAGTVTQLAFITEPTDTIYGSTISSVVVKTQDQFNNPSVNELTDNLNVELTLNSETGELHGETLLDIGRIAGNGIITFTDLTVDSVGVDNLLTASATGLAPADSDHFEITKKSLTATVTVDNKTYDGNNTAKITDVVPDDIVGSDVVEADFSVATAIFDDVNANDGVDITTTGVTLTGDDALNYTLADEDITGTASINLLEITITPNTLQTKVYGDVDPVFTYTFAPALISPDVFTGALSRDSGIDVGTYDYTLGTLADGLDNYALTLVLGTFEITQRTLTVTATGLDKVYNANRIAEVTLSDDRVPGDALTTTYTMAEFDTEDVGTGKVVSVSGMAISGTDSGNYTLASGIAETNADITEKELTVTGSTVTSKTYDGTTVATITGATLVGKVGSEDVVLETYESGTFDTKNVGNGKMVTTAMTVTGTDVNNYTLSQPIVTGSIIKKAITLTAVAGEKVYDGNTTAIATPGLTGELIPDDVGVYTETYDNENVGTGKTLTPAVVSILDGEGIDMTGNYDVALVTTDLGTIIQASLTATVTVENKVIDGDDLATIIGVSFDGVIGGRNCDC